MHQLNGEISEPAQSQNVILMNNTNEKISLIGNWKYIPDAEEKLSLEEVLRIYKEENPGEMKIPSNWEVEGLHNFNGAVWFIKEFNFASTKNSLNILKFNGVDYLTYVWLNKNYLGRHEGYFQPFIFNVTNQIEEKNILIIKVTSPFEEPGKVWPLKKKLIKGIFNHHDCRPGGWDLQKGQDKNTGGIWNTIEIKSGFPVYISNLKFSSEINFNKDTAQIFFKIKYLTGNSSDIYSMVDFNITSPSGVEINKSFEAGFKSEDGEFAGSIEIQNPELWWSWDLADVSLYKIKISSKDFEEENISFGIRDVRLNDEQEFFINGKRLFLRGTNLIPEQFLSNLTKEKISAIVKLIKEANINIVRVHAHVNRKELYEEFDKQGILVWQDFALQWTYYESSEFTDNAVSQIKDMVRLLYNYSSIAFWCCHNEPGEQINTLDNFLFDAVLEEDKTRIIRKASNYEEHPYDGWYWGNKEHFAAAPMGPLVTEFGAQAIPNIDSLKKFLDDDEIFPLDVEKWQYHNFQPDQTFNIAKVETGDSINSFITNSQNYQSDLLKTAVEFYRRKKFKGITGIFQFMFIDCWPSITWSVVDYFENKKSGYEVLKHVYQPLFISINVRQNQYYPGKKILLDIFIINDLHKSFSNCSLVFFLNGKECYSINNIDVNEDDILFISYEKINFLLDENISLGEHKMKLILKQNDESISKNEFKFKVVEGLYQKIKR